MKNNSLVVFTKKRFSKISEIVAKIKAHKHYDSLAAELLASSIIAFVYFFFVGIYRFAGWYGFNIFLLTISMTTAVIIVARLTVDFNTDTTPAITLGKLAAGKMPVDKAIGKIGVQLIAWFVMYQIVRITLQTMGLPFVHDNLVANPDMFLFNFVLIVMTSFVWFMGTIAHSYETRMKKAVIEALVTAFAIYMPLVFGIPPFVYTWGLILPAVFGGFEIYWISALIPNILFIVLGLFSNLVRTEEEHD